LRGTAGTRAKEGWDESGRLQQPACASASRIQLVALAFIPPAKTRPPAARNATTGPPGGCTWGRALGEGPAAVNAWVVVCAGRRWVAVARGGVKAVPHRPSVAHQEIKPACGRRRAASFVAGLRASGRGQIRSAVPGRCGRLQSFRTAYDASPGTGLGHLAARWGEQSPTPPRSSISGAAKAHAAAQRAGE